MAQDDDQLIRDVHEILEQRAAELRAEHHQKSDDTSDLESFFIFHMGETMYALRMADITEIHDAVPITPVPRVPEFLAGIVNLRGQIMSILDLRSYFNITAKVHFDASEAKIIIVTTDRFQTGIIVNKVVEKVNVRPEHIRQFQVKGQDQEYISRVVQFQGHNVGIINIMKLLAQDEFLINLN